MGNLLMEVFFRVYIFADKYKARIISLFVVASFGYGFYIYKNIYGLNVKQSLSYTVGLYAVDIKTPKEIEYIISENKLEELKKKKVWEEIYKASLLAKFTVFLTIFLIFIRTILSWVYRHLLIWRGEHTIVIGLGRNSRFFINSFLEKYKHCMMVFEIDKENPYLDIYKNKKVSIVVGEVDKMMDSLNLDKCQNVFISTGNDEKNIYYALRFLEKLKGNPNFNKLLVHIEDRTLRNFYSDEGALNNSKIDLKVFSFYKESARMFFQKVPLEGEGLHSVSQTKEDFSIHIIGDDDLSIAMTVEACKLAHYANKNRLTINCIAKDAEALKEKIDFSFPEIGGIETVIINYKSLDNSKKEFYTDEIWKDVSTLKHVFYCSDDTLQNIKTATKVADKTFLRRSEEAKKIQFHIATMNQKKIAKEIELLNKENLFIFAQAEEVCSCENLLENEIDEIASLINYDYYLADKEFSGYTPSQQKKATSAKELWKMTLINDKKSSVGQAIHIRTKLRYLGLETEKVHKAHDKKGLLEKNEQAIDDALGKIEDYVSELDKLAMAEHNRWMALLMLMDYKCADIAKKDKIQKYHPLLKAYSKFSEEEKKVYFKYDVNAILKIAEYEAKVTNRIKLKSHKEK